MFQIPHNTALEGLSEGMLEAWKIYNVPKYGNIKAKCQSTKYWINLWKNVFRAIILFVVEGEGQVYNVCDQKFHEFEIRKQNPDCYVMRKNLTEIAEQGKLVGEDSRLFVDGQEVAVVYFRCGYVLCNTVYD